LSPAPYLLFLAGKLGFVDGPEMLLQDAVVEEELAAEGALLSFVKLPSLAFVDLFLPAMLSNLFCFVTDSR
jgi:hypothetical protein